MNCNSRVPAEKLETFLLQMADDLYRAKGFVDLEEQGWSQVDLVGHRVDIKPCEPQPQSQLVFISKIGPQVIRKLAEVWEQPGRSADAVEKLGGATDDDGTKGHRRRLR